MIKKTKDYEMFVFRDDNRLKINQTHVTRLMNSIKARNLLEFRPIHVNEKMEVIDGQNRLLAAKNLDVEIYYQIENSLSANDIITLNVSQSWGINDYLNFYSKNGYMEYIKLSDFMKKNNITLKIALTIAMGETKTGMNLFKSGQFKFNHEQLDQEIWICWQTIDFIKKMNGYSYYTKSSRFWKALLKMINNPAFDTEKWMSNAKKMVDNFCAKATTKEYLAMFQHIYNWRNNNKISIREDEV